MGWGAIVSLATSTVEVAEALVSIINAQKTALGLKKVYRGDPQLIPDFPSVSINGRVKARELKGTHQYRLLFLVEIVVQFEKIQEDTETRIEIEPTAESIDTLLLGNRKLVTADNPDGWVIHGYVTRIDYGMVKSKTEMNQAARLTWEGQSQQIFA